MELRGGFSRENRRLSFSRENGRHLGEGGGLRRVGMKGEGSSDELRKRCSRWEISLALSRERGKQQH